MSHNMNEDRKEKQNIVDTVNSNNIAIQEVIEKAVLDSQFKKDLIENPDEVLANYDISEIGKIMIKSLSEEDFDKLTPENIDEYFAADSAIYTPDFDEDIPIEYSDEGDI